MFVNSSYVNSAYAFDSYGTNLKQQKEQRDKSTNKSNEDGHKNNLAQKDRVTYGTVALRLMSDKEYTAFDRVTETLHTQAKKSYAEVVDSFTNDYLEEKHVLHGKSMYDTLHDHDESFTELQKGYNTYGGMDGVLDNALNNISTDGNSDNQSIITFIKRFQASLTVEKLDLTV
jgi:hypothetical protein